MMLLRHLSLALALSAWLITPVLADKSDSSKPMDFRSNSANMDEYRKLYNYIGQVRMTQGSRLMVSELGLWRVRWTYILVSAAMSSSRLAVLRCL